MKDWFSAHKDGLRQIAERLVERRGFGIVIGELYQNVADTNANKCVVYIKPVPNKSQVELTVVDNDKTGFKDLSHAWTVFAPSEKKGDPTKAGRFNLGEKMVLSFCQKASIMTTVGTVEFDATGRHNYPRRKTERGTEFHATLNCIRERYQEMLDYLERIIVRLGLTLTVNGKDIVSRKPIHTFEASLQTEIGDDLRKTIRKTTVEVYESAGDEVASLYELGIPVVETDDKWHINVLQKVPLNIDRDNVTPAYLRHLRVAVYNEMHQRINEEDTTVPWVQEAAEDSNCTPEAVHTFKVKKYGEKSVASDPTNPEADAEAQAGGYTVIPARGLSKGQRRNMKEAGVLVSSSTQFPKAGKGAYSNDPDAPPVEVIHEENLTDQMKLVRGYTKVLGKELLDCDIMVRFVRCKSGPGGTWAACYSKGNLDYNVWVLGKSWFDEIGVKTDDLIIHEFGHHYESNHLSHKYYEALSNLGARLVELAVSRPKMLLTYRQ